MKLAPIALFVYNRPAHTRRTLEALQNNELANRSDLFIYSDAPSSELQAEEVREVRQYIRSVEGFKSVTVIERETNFGLAQSIIEGVTEIVNKYGRIIVVEDDLVTSPYFLTFMNDALNVYQDEEKVMHISGYMFPIDATDLPETFFLRTASCWGWATWARAWKYFRKEPSALITRFDKKTINCFNMDGSYDMWAQVEQNASGKMNTWAIFWYAAIFQAKGLCLHPALSLVINIGHDGTGEHCGQTTDFSTSLTGNPISHFEKNIEENALAHKRTIKFLSTIAPNFFQRIVRVVKRQPDVLKHACRPTH